MILEKFKETLPNKPYCSDYHENGLRIRSKSVAIKHRHIQHNQPHIITWLAFDIDRNESGLEWYDLGAPPPNIIVQNREEERSHCHFLYMLEKPVYVSMNARTSPIRYLSTIENGLSIRLKSDPGYSGFITKNPLSSAWRVWSPREEGYSLAELYDYVDSEKIDFKATNREIRGCGRNVEIFDKLRFWAYDRIKEAKKGSYEAWVADLTAQALDFNLYTHALDFKEVATIARSVARWTWTKYTGDSKNRGVLGFGDNRYTNPDMPRLSDDQKRYRQSSGARYTNIVRRTATEAKISKAIAKLRAEGKKPSKAAVARLSGIARSKVVSLYSHLFD